MFISVSHEPITDEFLLLRLLYTKSKTLFVALLSDYWRPFPEIPIAFECDPIEFKL